MERIQDKLTGGLTRYYISTRMDLTAGNLTFPLIPRLRFVGLQTLLENGRGSVVILLNELKFRTVVR